MQTTAIGVNFENQPKILNYNPQNQDYKIGDFVVVETERGIEVGKIASGTKTFLEEPETPLKPIIRIANKQDIEKYENNKIEAKNYMVRTRKIVKKFQLEMKIVFTEFTLDKSKIIISFTAERRVDFRELVRSLASEFKMKIELRQIGPRDEVKLLKSYGICGKPCCCTCNTDDFEHVSIKMAKMQGLALNPNNISGVCGRLMCCLGYENSQYAEIYKKMPRINSDVKTIDGIGKVLYNNILKKTVQVKIEDSYKEYNLDDIQVFRPNQLNNEDSTN